jgi:hypothetical protein
MHNPHTALVHATVTRVLACLPDAASAQGGTLSYSCRVDVTFTHKGHRYTSADVSAMAPAPLAVGAALDLRIDPKRPGTGGAYQGMSPKAAGWGLVGAGLVVGGLTAAVAVLAFKYKGFAAAEGALGMYGALR